MNRVWTEEILKKHIEEKVEESFLLDYKSAGAFEKQNNKTRDITKDVSAFANSTGGVIIYGIAEFREEAKKHLPEKITPINRLTFSREWVENIINLIQPKIEGVIINTVPLSTGPDDVAYVIEIPQSSTAHQATDCVYYRRFNFESVPMRDYEVRDVMGRRKYPKIITSVRIIFDKHEKVNGVFWRVQNQSPVIAHHVQTILDIPWRVEGKFLNFENRSFVTLSSGESCVRIPLSNNNGIPLFPQSDYNITIPFKLGPDLSHVMGKSINDIRFKTFADEMPLIEGIIPITDAIKYV